MTKEAAEALEELGEETDNMITTQSKLRETIMNATKAASADGKGFDILDDNGNYKSTYEIMLGLAELYDDIVESDKELGTNNLNLLLETIAGKNRANIAASILQNPEVLKNVFNDSAINSTNSALEENEKYLESIEGHLQKFQNAVQDLFYSLLDSGIVNDVIDLGTKLINILDAIVDALGSTGSLLATGGLIVVLRKLPDILSYSITNFPQLIKNIKTLSYLFSNGFSLKSTVSDLYNLSYSLETAEQQAALLGKTLKGLKGLGIAAVITAVAYAGFQLYDAYEHMGDKAKEVFEEYENNINTLKSYKDEIQSLNNTINNSSDFNEVRDARKRVLEIQNLMIDNYGLESEEVKNLTENLGDNSDAWDRLSDSQWEAAKRDFEDDTSFWEKVVMQMEGATSRIDYMLKQMESDLNDFNFMIPKEAIDDAYALADAFEDLSVLTVNGTNLLNISYDGTTEGLYSRLLEIKKLSSDIISEDSAIMDGIQGAITHYGDLIDEYGDFYNQYVLQERIYKNSNYEKYYQGMAKAYDDFVEAYANGNEELVDATTDSLLEQYDSLTKALAADETLSDTERASILGVFDDLYPDLKNKINGWRFEIHFEANTDNLKTRVEEALDMWDGNVDGSINVDAGILADVLAGDEIPGTEDYKREAYDALKEIATEYGYAEDEWEQFLQRLVDMGVIAAGNLVTNVEKSSSSIFNYNSLSTAVKNMSDKILPQFEALGEAYDAIFNGDKGFTLADVDTSTLENIRSTFEDLDEDLDIDWDDQISAVESFLSVIGNVSSTEGEVQEAFNNLATSYFNAAVAAGDFSEENAVVLEQMMSEMGIINADEVSAFYRNLAEAQEYASSAGKDLTNITAEEITKLADEGTISQVTSQYLAYLAMVKRLTSETPVSTSSDIEQLEALAEAAGMAADYLALVARAKAIALEVEKGNTGRQAELDAYIAKLQNYSPPEIELDFGVSGDTSSASSAGGDAADAYVEAFEEELEALEKQRDAGIISEAQFLEKYKELIEKYFKDVDGYGEEYAERMADYWDRVIEYMESVVSAIDTLLDKKIDAAEEGKDAAVSALEEEQEAAEKYYQDQIDYLDTLIEAIDDAIDAKQSEIDAIDDEIDALETANEKRQQQINLQKAQYQLQQAMNQKVKRVYKDGQMVRFAIYKRYYIGQRVMGH